MFAQVIGGAAAVAVGVYMTNSIGQESIESVAAGGISVQDSVLVVNRSRFTNCRVASLADSSFGSSSVFGGAFAVLHSPQVSNFRSGLLLPSYTTLNVTGFNLTVLIAESFFARCSIFSNTSNRPGGANGGGGALYTKSAALTNFSVTESSFKNNFVTVASGSTGLSSFSSGGALAVETGDSKFSFVAVSSCIFVNCTVQGAQISNMGVLGGAVHVLHAARISVVATNFTNCSILYAVGGDIVSGGSAMSAVVTGSMSVISCVFDASEGRDMSETSTGLLFLARNSSRVNINVLDCEFVSSSVVVSIQCVDDDGVRRVAGLCVGPIFMLQNSTIFQVPSNRVSDFNFSATGSSLMSLQISESLSFLGSRLHCASPRFAVFMEHPVESSTTALYSCKPCLPFHISSTATVVSLEELSNAQNVDRCFPASGDGSASGCPFAISDCTTFVSVSSGFWANISESATLVPARRCPPGYCGCASATNGTCPLPPPISIDSKDDPLCNGNRIGTLCGGCRPGFTQSMDDRNCISNQACSESMWWVWTLSVLGYVAYSLYIVVSCLNRSDGAIACLLFFFQMSSFATVADDSNAFATVLEYAQVHSVVAMYQNACYAPSMSAYNATALKLIGPLLVLLFVVAWTKAIQKLQQRNSVDIRVSYSSTIVVAVLFVFSNVASVVFTLVECSSYSEANAVVFIDGTVPCKDMKWNILVFVAALLFVYPAALAAALRHAKVPPNVRNAVCGKFTAPVFYWGAVTLSFRLLISFTQFMRVDVPNLMAFARLLLSVGALFLLVYLRPYVHVTTFWLDVACYVCLIVQFGLQGFSANRDFMGVAESSF